jgi:chemotaxis protein methyltransferase WspC
MNKIDQIAALLKQTMGLDVASVGSMLIERAVDERIAARHLVDRDAYLLALQHMPDEMQALIEAVIVSETWFFRDREAMLAVARLAREVSVQQSAQVIRILSLPCSTGEEPYSIAMALLDAGVPATRFRIHAIDICHRSLAVAQRGIYTRNSFRGKELEYRDRHMTRQGESYTIADTVRKQVDFRYGNMFAPDFMQHEAPYDFIFCRNVLIYFDRPMQHQAVGVLERLLAPNGTLFVGPAETGIMLRPSFASSGISLAFAFHKKTVHDKPVILPAKKSLPQLMDLLPPVITPKRKPTTPVVSVAPATPRVVVPDAQKILQQAIDCANQGQLEEALLLCKQYQKIEGSSAGSFYLMALITDANNDAAGALSLYRKVLYLEPDHIEALTHIAALLTSQGDLAGAKLMQQRAQRAKEQAHA